jgi:hypothetical protein
LAGVPGDDERQRQFVFVERIPKMGKCGDKLFEFLREFPNPDFSSARDVTHDKKKRGG